MFRLVITVAVVAIFLHGGPGAAQSGGSDIKEDTR